MFLNTRNAKLLIFQFCCKNKINIKKIIIQGHKIKYKDTYTINIKD